MHSSWLYVTLNTKGGFNKHFNGEHKCGLCNKVFAGTNELEEHECSAMQHPVVNSARRSSVHSKLASST